MKKDLCQEWNRILSLEKASPYVFRTRLERVVNHTVKYADLEKDNVLLNICKNVLNKLQYISDQSNQTSEGCLNSFIILKTDMVSIRDVLSI